MNGVNVSVSAEKLYQIIGEQQVMIVALKERLADVESKLRMNEITNRPGPGGESGEGSGDRCPTSCSGCR